MKRLPVQNIRFWLIVIFAAGVLYLFSLDLLVSKDIFFSGDSGLRAMISQNLAKGSLVFDLNLPDPPWIKALWDQGLFPYDAPFVYSLGGKYFVTFPYTFSLVTAPFYAAFGFRGLYVIPFVSTLFIWLIFYRLCKKLHFHPAATAVGLFFLIFPTNLTLFGSIYWEHTLSVGLAFAGFALMIPASEGEEISVGAILAAGILTGLATWFRPEQIFLVLFLGLISLYGFVKACWGWRLNQRFDPGSMPDFIGKKGWMYLASSSVTLVLYGVSNWVVYKNFFGTHSIQVLEQKSLWERFSTFIGNLHVELTGDTSFFLYTPIALFLVGFLVFALANKHAQVKFEREWSLWYIFFPLFILGVAVLVPPGAGGKQWGPRFLLLLVPLVTLLFTWQLDRLLKHREDLSRGAWQAAVVSIILIALAGIIQDPIRGRDYIAYNYDLVRPAAVALLSDSEPVIGISSYHLGQVFQPVLGREVYFLAAKNMDEMSILGQGLLDHGLDTFTYICYANDCKIFEPDNTDTRVMKNGLVVQTLSVNDCGKYIIRKLRVRRSP